MIIIWRLCAVLICALICAPVLHADSPPLTLQQVLDKHLQALGGPAAVAVSPKAQRITGTLSVGGLHGTFTAIDKGLSQQWYEEKMGIYDETSGSDGKVFWRRDTNGAVRLLSTDEIKQARVDQYIDSYSYLFHDRLPGTVKLEAKTEPKTGDYILDVAATDGKSAFLYLNPRSFLPDKMNEGEGEDETTTFYRKYKMMGGAMQATEQQTGTGDKKYDARQTIDSITDIDDPGDLLFAIPPSVKNFVWLQPGATSSTVAIDPSDDSVNFYAALNGRPAYLILDSGAGGFSLDLSVANYLKIKHQGTLAVNGYGGVIDSYPFVMDTLELPGEIVFSSLIGRAINTTMFSPIDRVIPAVGIIGYPLLAQMVVRVDVAGQTLTLTDPATWKPGPLDGQPVAMEIDNNVPTILAQVDDLPPARFLIDTGDYGSITLYDAYLKKNNLRTKYPKTIDQYGRGVGGDTLAKKTRLGSFTLGGVKILGVPADMMTDSVGEGDQSIAGAIGMKVLSRFAFTFDYVGHRIFFAPESEAAKPFDMRTFGVEVLEVPDDMVKHKPHFIIEYVDDKSPASRNGLTEGSELVKIDGAPVKEMGLKEIRRLLSLAGGKDTHDLEIIGHRGGNGRYHIALYEPLPTH